MAELGVSTRLDLRLISSCFCRARQKPKVSGEYAMIKYAAAAGALNEKDAVLESHTCLRRAGADIILTYHAVEAARWLQGR